MVLQIAPFSFHVRVGCCAVRVHWSEVDASQTAQESNNETPAADGRTEEPAAAAAEDKPVEDQKEGTTAS